MARHAHNVEAVGSTPTPAIHGILSLDRIPFLPKGGFMNPNEIRITKENQERLIKEAEKLGPSHVAALMEQIERQGEKTK